MPTKSQDQPQEQLSTSKPSGSVFTPQWNFGLNKDVAGGCVLNLGNDVRSLIAYAAGHTAILYDTVKHEQKLLSGHVNEIRAMATSADRRWLVTTDAGKESSTIIVWDTQNAGLPVKTIFDPHGGLGASAVDMSHDARYIVTVGGAASCQTIAVWDWTRESNEPLCQCTLEGRADVQTCIRFNPEDSSEIVLNGAQSVSFAVWSDENGISAFTPELDEKDFLHTVSAYTVSSFLPLNAPVEGAPATLTNPKQKLPVNVATGSLEALNSLVGHAITGTTDGNVVVWSDRSLNNLELPLQPRGQKAAIKFVHLHAGRVTVLQTFAGKYIVSAGADGFVRVHDTQFRILAWREEEQCGPIVSLSFRAAKEVDGRRAQALSKTFDVPEYVLATVNCELYAVRKTAGAVETKKFMQTQCDAIQALAVHPSLPQFAVGGSSRAMHIWDYDAKVLTAQRLFDDEQLTIEAIAYSPNGLFIALGFTNGVIKIVDSSTLKDLSAEVLDGSDGTVKTNYAHFDICSAGSIRKLLFHAESRHLAAYDSENRVSLLALEPTAVSSREQWIHVGSMKSHAKAIVGLEFFNENGRLVLASVGQDRCMVKYDVRESSFANGLKLLDRKKIEQLAFPTATCWQPGKKEYLIMASNAYKLKLINAQTFNTRRTTLAPVLGGELVKLQVLPTQREEYKDKLLVYTTGEQQIGVIKLPLDGNPNRAMAWIAHPGAIADCVSTCDGRFLITAGRYDYSINMVAVDPVPLDVQIAYGGDGHTPFMRMLPDGGEGAFFKQLEDFFYFAQIRSQGEDTTDLRKIGRKLAVDQVPAFMQALGYYPTDKEIDDLLNEIKYDHVTVDGEVVEAVEIGELVKLYINHRPVQDCAEEDISRALRDVMLGQGQGEDTKSRNTYDTAMLLRQLQEHGEVFTDDELSHTIATLLEDHSPVTGSDGVLGERVSAREFVRNVLGMQEAAVEGV